MARRIWPMTPIGLCKICKLLSGCWEDGGHYLTQIIMNNSCVLFTESSQDVALSKRQIVLWVLVRRPLRKAVITLAVP